MPDELTPLLGNVRLPSILGGNNNGNRIHYLDNLRSILIISLILHHAVLETTQATAKVDLHSWNSVPLALFIQVNKSFLWTLFFLVAGFSSHLGFEKRALDHRFILSRILNLGLPAALWLGGGQFAVVSLLEYYGLHSVFPLGWTHDVQARLAGPVPFICVLLVFDIVHFAWRISQNYLRSIPHWWLVRRIATSKPAIYLFTGASIVFYTIIAFFSIFWVRKTYPAVYDIFQVPSQPIGFVIAYIAGINFRIIKKVIKVEHHIAALVGTQATAYVSLGIAQHFSPLLWENIRLGDCSEPRRVFVDPGFNFHTMFYVVWSTCVLFVLPITMMSAFSKNVVTKKNWGDWTRLTYVQTYFHMIPVLIGVHYIGRGGVFGDGIIKSLTVGVIGVLSSWMVAHIPSGLRWLQNKAK